MVYWGGSTQRPTRAQIAAIHTQLRAIKAKNDNILIYRLPKRQQPLIIYTILNRRILPSPLNPIRTPLLFPASLVQRTTTQQTYTILHYWCSVPPLSTLKPLCCPVDPLLIRTLYPACLRSGCACVLALSGCSFRASARAGRIVYLSSVTSSFFVYVFLNE